MLDLNRTEYELKIQTAHNLNINKSFPNDFIEYFVKCKNYTMLSRERLYDLYQSIIYTQKSGVIGDIVEIGCWAGGALAMSALTLSGLRQDKIKIWGYDTFNGHNKPSQDEYDVWGKNQADVFSELNGKDWAKVDIDTVKNNLKEIGIDSKSYKLIEGKIEETSNKYFPDNISILRIDVDWYEPTIISLNKFYPLISRYGILIIDDYGHHSGSKKAVDQYFSNKNIKFFHIDYSCIACVKF